MAHGFMTLLDLSTDERNVFEEMEQNFQRYVVGDVTPIREMYGKVGAKEINVEKVVNQTKVKVYFDRGVGFSERDVTETIDGIYFIITIDYINKWK